MRHTWSDVKAKARVLDPHTGIEQEAATATARERREAYVRGHQLAEMRKAAGLTRAELAENLGALADVGCGDRPDDQPQVPSLGKEAAVTLWTVYS